jgi:hypothetical protein
MEFQIDIIIIFLKNDFILKKLNVITKNMVKNTKAVQTYKKNLIRKIKVLYNNDQNMDSFVNLVNQITLDNPTSAPKKPPTEYNLFVKEQMQNLKTTDIYIKHTDKLKKIGLLWRERTNIVFVDESNSDSS